jgi:dCMP deaminase
MKLAIITSDLSTCARHHVGAVLACANNRHLASGRNGTKRGHAHCEDLMREGVLSYEDHQKWSVENEIHAEINAIEFCKEYNLPTEGTTLYVTHCPCPECTSAIIEAGVKKVVFLEPWTNDGVDTAAELHKAGIECVQYPSSLKEMQQMNCKQKLTLKEQTCNVLV